MAARKNRIHPDPEWVERQRNSIKSVMLIKALSEHVEGKRDLKNTQVNAALGLLKKTMPDLAATDHSGDINVNHVARVPEVANSLDTWQEQHDAPTIQ